MTTKVLIKNWIAIFRASKTPTISLVTHETCEMCERFNIKTPTNPLVVVEVMVYVKGITRHEPILVQCYISIAPENVRKPKVY